MACPVSFLIALVDLTANFIVRLNGGRWWKIPRERYREFKEFEATRKLTASMCGAPFISNLVEWLDCNGREGEPLGK